MLLPAMVITWSEIKVSSRFKHLDYLSLVQTFIDGSSPAQFQRDELAFELWRGLLQGRNQIARRGRSGNI
jgi:hypothetical protein